MLSPGDLAILHYETPHFDVIHRGRYVLCAVTGAQIALADLRYWSAEHQEAYCDAATASAAILAGGSARLRAGR